MFEQECDENFDLAESNVSLTFSKCSSYGSLDDSYINKPVDNNSSGFDGNHENLSDVIPPLDIGSASTDTTTNNAITSSDTKLVVKKPIKTRIEYETWLEKKRKQKLLENERRLDLERKLKEERESKLALSKAKVEEWNKSKQARTKQSKVVASVAKKMPVAKKTPDKSADKCADEAVKQRRLDNWQKKKQMEEKLRAAKKAAEIKRANDIEKQRREKNEEAFQQWLVRTANYPKPVPSNRGLFSLRGTLAPQYVNPNEWQ